MKLYNTTIKADNRRAHNQDSFQKVKSTMALNVPLGVFLAICLTVQHLQASDTVIGYVNLRTVHHVTDERYLSLAVGPSLIRHNWGHFDLSSSRLYTLARALSPAIFRMGGNEADLLVLNWTTSDAGDPPDWEDYGDDVWTDFDYDAPHHVNDRRTNFTMTTRQWDQLNVFTRSVGWNLLFDLNVLLRRGEQWDSSNAVELLKYSISRNYTHNLNLELGNEPNAFRHYINRTVNPIQLGKDFLQLNYLIRQTPLEGFFRQSLLVGPDTTKPRKDKSGVIKYLRAFLKVAGDSLSAITWHQYYVNGRTATASDFINPDVLELLSEEAARVKAVIQEVGLSHKPLMLGETGSCWGGGAANLSNRYAAGFLWLDKLGVAAQMGHSIVMRQTFFGGHYAMVDNDINPTPDYWLSLLYKTLVGTHVLNTTTSDSSHRTRLYAHCTAPGRSGYPGGSVTLYVLNLHTTSVDLTLNGDLSSKVKHVYWFMPHGGEGLSARYVDVNGEKMMMVDDATFPKVAPKVVSEVVTLPQTSFGFIVIPGAQVSVCM